MDYTQQPISIHTSVCGPASIMAQVAIDTGLAYHKEHRCNGEDTGRYVLTHIGSGYTLVEYMVESEEQAQRWLELVSKLADWNKPMSTLKRYKSLPRKIKEAHRQVLRESMITA